MEDKNWNQALKEKTIKELQDGLSIKKELYEIYSSVKITMKNNTDFDEQHRPTAYGTYTEKRIVICSRKTCGKTHAWDSRTTKKLGKRQGYRTACPCCGYTIYREHTAVID